MTHRRIQPVNIIPAGRGDFIGGSGIDQKRHFVLLTNAGHGIGHGTAVSAADHDYLVLGNQFFHHGATYLRTTGIVFHDQFEFFPVNAPGSIYLF